MSRAAAADREDLYRERNFKDMSNSGNSDCNISSYNLPEKVMTPREALDKDTGSVPLSEAAGRISGEFVMCYPPGIPILVPGERVTDNIIRYINYAKTRGCTITGTEDHDALNLSVLL